MPISRAITEHSAYGGLQRLRSLTAVSSDTPEPVDDHIDSLPLLVHTLNADPLKYERSAFRMVTETAN
jgi:hypothetical protein